MTIQRPASLEALNTKVYKSFGDGLKSASTIDVQALCSIYPSESKFNTYAHLVDDSGMKEWIGARDVRGLRERTFTVTNRKFHDTIEVKEDDLLDGQIADSLSAMEQLATGAARLEEDLFLEVLENGQNLTCITGQNLFDTDHPIDFDAAGTQRNYYASGLALDATNLATAVAAMKGFKGENGRPMGRRPNILLVPSALEKTARELVEAQTVTNGGENVLSNYGLKVVVWERLSSATRWFLMDTQGPGARGILVQRRQAPRFVSKTAPSDENVFWRASYVYGVDARAAAAPGNPFRIFSAAA